MRQGAIGLRQQINLRQQIKESRHKFSIETITIVAHLNNGYADAINVLNRATHIQSCALQSSLPVQARYMHSIPRPTYLRHAVFIRLSRSQ